MFILIKYIIWDMYYVVETLTLKNINFSIIKTNTFLKTKKQIWLS